MFTLLFYYLLFAVGLVLGLVYRSIQEGRAQAAARASLLRLFPRRCPTCDLAREMGAEAPAHPCLRQGGGAR